VTADVPMRIGHRAERCTVLGPGTRAVLWLQGCARRCPGCIAPELWPREGGQATSALELAEWTLGLGGIDGLTVSGGEPMDQAEGLEVLLGALRSARPGLSVLCYSGYSLEALRAGTPAQVSALKLLDVLIDGPYLEDEDSGAPLRGSDNQRIWLLSPHHTLDDLVGGASRRVEVVIEMDGFTLMGIPPRGFRTHLEGSLRSRGVCLPECREGPSR
jgi:anaerobic ribonucleoside-triphosphate reductase activating protein